MTEQQHHHDALVETARSELERAHAAAVAMDGGELRRGLELALAAVRQAGALPDAPATGTGGQVGPILEQALAELDNGRLSDMEHHVEQARTALNG